MITRLFESPPGDGRAIRRPPVRLSSFKELEEASAAQQAEIAIAIKLHVTVDVGEAELPLFR